jgi:hypothetical protein
MRRMTTESVIVLSGGDDAAARRNLEEFAVLVCDQARKRGCKTRAVWAGVNLQLRIQQGCADTLREVFQWLAETAAEQGASVTVGEDQPAGACIHDIEDAPIAWGTVVHARLTRDLLCNLPEGAFLVCNVAPCEVPVPLGRLGPYASRAEQWQRARTAGLDGTLSRVFWTEEDFRAFCDGISAQPVEAW